MSVCTQGLWKKEDQHSPWWAIASEAVLHNGKRFVDVLAEGVWHHTVRMLLVQAVWAGILGTCQKKEEFNLLVNYHIAGVLVRRGLISA